MLKFLHEFPDAFFHGEATESLLRDEEVLSANLEQGVKRAIMFDPTVRSRSNFYTSFQLQFSSGYLRNRYSMTRRSGRPYLSNGSNNPNFGFDRWIAFKILQEFPDAVFLGVPT